MICRGGIVGANNMQAAGFLRAKDVDCAAANPRAFAVPWVKVMVAIAVLAAALAVLSARATVPPLVESDYCYQLIAADRMFQGRGLTCPNPVAPFQPWALALYEYRQRNGLKDDPTRACIAPSGPRHLHTAGGFRIIRDPTYDRMYLLFGGGNRNWRIVFMDGRQPPNPEEVSGTYFGHQAGHWEDDTLVVESSGYNARFWFSNGGLPHTEALRLTERFSRPDFDTLKYEVTVDDPLTYTRRWTAEWTVAWVDGEEIAERFCEDHRLGE